MSPQNLKSILSQYQLDDMDNLEVSPFGSGLIHHTYLVRSGKQEFILQHFNDEVFSSPETISDNFMEIKNHLSPEDLDFELPLPVPTKSGELWARNEGQLYRLLPFVSGKTLQQIQEPNQGYLAAKAYAQFSMWGERIDLENLNETISNFHRLDLRFDRFMEVAKEAQDLNSQEKEILDFYVDQKELVDNYLKVSSQVPPRLTHNDTKINNLIYSDDLKKVNAVIDLDTIMPGYLLYDFGDLIRTAACNIPENSDDWENHGVNMYFFSSLLNGYLDGLGSGIDEVERESLLISGEIMTLMMGLRFFTDHLQGNIYYNVAHPMENLIRSKNQMLYLQCLRELRPEIRAIYQELLMTKTDN